MKELLRTNNLVTISFVETLLKEADIPFFVADQGISAVEGSLGIFGRRVLVPEEDVEPARRLLRDAGLGAELKP